MRLPFCPGRSATQTSVLPPTTLELHWAGPHGWRLLPARHAKYLPWLPAGRSGFLPFLPQQIVSQQISGGVVFWIAYNRYSPAAGDHNIAFRHILLSVISAFCMNIGAQQAYKFSDVRRIKECDRIYITERRQNLRTVIAWDAGTAFTFERARACI